MRTITAIIFAVSCDAIVVVFAPAGALADLLKAGDMARPFSTEAIYGAASGQGSTRTAAIAQPGSESL